jgi:hypothetical protein
MIKWLKIIGVSLLAIMILLGGLVIGYMTPVHELATVTGVEVKRVNSDGVISAKNPANGPTIDVYYIYLKKQDGTTLVGRNQDTGFGLPLYLKFDSADVQAKAKELSDKNDLIEVSYYGWRSNIFSMFPNVLDVEQTQKNTASFNLLRWITFILYFLIVSYGTFKLFKKIRKINEKNI